MDPLTFDFTRAGAPDGFLQFMEVDGLFVVAFLNDHDEEEEVALSPDQALLLHAWLGRAFEAGS